MSFIARWVPYSLEIISITCQDVSLLTIVVKELNSMLAKGATISYLNLIASV